MNASRHMGAPLHMLMAPYAIGNQELSCGSAGQSAEAILVHPVATTHSRRFSTALLAQASIFCARISSGGREPAQLSHPENPLAPQTFAPETRYSCR